MIRQTRQRGSALIAAIFLIVVVAALGVFAARLSTSQSHATRLQLLQARAEAAATTGLEFASNRARAGACGDAQFVVDSFSIAVTCTQIPASPAAAIAFELESTAFSGNYGQPDFVQRKATRRVSSIGPGTW